MKRTFFARHALVILMAVFFLLPFGLRGARQSLQHMKNDVKDWLPSEYDETGDLNWFKEHFLGEQFVVVSWEGCRGTPDDATFKIFLQKLLPSIPPSIMQAELRKIAQDQTGNENQGTVEALEAHQEEIENVLFNRVLMEAEVPITHADFIGDDLGLYTPHDVPSLHLNWGGKQEKWLRGSGGLWYYITPSGELYRWLGADAPVAAAGRWIWRNVVGENLSGELVKDFGEIDGPWYYENPRRLRGQLFKTVTCGPGVLNSLTNDEAGVLRNAPEEAMKRLQGTLFGPDGKQTCLFLTLSDVARNDLHQVCGRAMLGKPLGRLYEIASESGLTAEELRLGGPPIDNVAIDEEGTITLVRLVGLSVLLGLGLSYACFRSITATLMVFFVGGVSAVMSVAFVWWFGSSMDAIMMSMPSLVYVLGLSGSVHLMNYYQQAVEEHGEHGAAEHAVAHAWKPAILCNITTAIGLVSLYTSEIVPIRKFGLFSAIAVMAMLVIVFTYLPAALKIWPQIPKRKINSDEQSWLEQALGGFWHVLGKWIIDHHNFVAITATLFIALVGYGVTQIQTSVNLLKMFDPSAKIIGDYSWLEEKLGRLVPMEVVVKVGANSLASTIPATEVPEAPTTLEAAKEKALQDLLKINFLGRMELTSRVQQVVETEFGSEGSDEVGRAMSAATFAPVLPGVKNDLSTFSERRATNKKLEENRDAFLASDYLRLDRQDQAELWRISVRLAASKKVDYGSFVQNLQNVVTPVLTAYSNRETVIRAIAEQKFAAAVAANATADSEEQLDVAGVPKAVNPAMSSVLIVGKPVAEPLAATSHRIQIQTLSDLLATSRMKVDIPKAETVLDAEKLAKYSSVLLVGEVDSATKTLVEQNAKQIIDLNQPNAPAGVTNLSAVYTGVVPIVYKAQRALLESLVESTFWSFVTITPLMMWVSRSFGAGLVTMLPNVLPVFVIFGAMGWLGIEVDVGSMMTASIALGVAVDDTIHYLSWFREELDKCGDRKTAILRTYERCATPTFQAALISGLGLSIFAFSTFTPTQRFGYLMLTILWAGVVSELIYFPALLAGPLGWVFKPRLQSGSDHHAAESNEHLDAAPESELELVAEQKIANVVKFPLIKPHMVRHDHPHGKSSKKSS
jgi:uncharacterized protein